MLFYLTLAIAVTVLLYSAQRFESVSKLISVLLYIIPIVLLCHFAGARDIAVGTDTAGYAYDSFWTASHSSFYSFYVESSFSAWAPLYKLMSWIVINTFNTFYSYLFFIEFLIVVPVIFVCRRVLSTYLPFGAFLFVLLFYPMSFNMMRQMISMSILLLAYLEATRGKFYKFLVFLLIGMLFHNTALVGLLIYPLMRYSDYKKLSGGIKLIGIIIFGVLFVLVSPYIMQIVSRVLGRYEAYLDGGSYMLQGSGTRTLAISVVAFLIISLFSWLFLHSFNINTEIKNNITKLALISSFGVVCLALSLISFYLYRISMYFLYFVILLIPILCRAVRDPSSRQVLLALSVCVLLFWSFDYYVIQESNQVVPYKMTTNESIQI